MGRGEGKGRVKVKKELNRLVDGVDVDLET